MKTEILISGQISGNFTLRSAISTAECEEKRSMFNGFILTFPTKKAAYKAMWNGFKYLRSDKEDANNSRISYCRGYISYDASKAKIID